MRSRRPHNFQPANPRALAINPATGEVYLVTAQDGVNLAHSTGKGAATGRGTIDMIPLDGSFQVLVVGN